MTLNSNSSYCVRHREQIQNRTSVSTSTIVLVFYYKSNKGAQKMKKGKHLVSHDAVLLELPSWELGEESRKCNLCLEWQENFRLTFVSCEFTNADSEIALICPVTMSIKFPIEVYYAALTAYCFSSAALTKQQWKSGDECKIWLPSAWRDCQ